MRCCLYNVGVTLGVVMLAGLLFAQQPRPVASAGIVEHGTYRNAYLGLEFTPPSSLELGTPEMRGQPGTVKLVITVSASESPQLFRVTNVIAFYSDEQAYYPAAKRTAEAYRDRVLRTQLADGYEQTQGPSEAAINGNKFLRIDVQKERVHEAILVCNHLTEALVFIFASADQKGVDSLIAGTKVSLSK